MFSFLTGKRGTDGRRRAGAAPVPTTRRGETGGQPPTASRAVRRCRRSNTAALTAPPPSSAADKPQVGPLDPAQTAALQGQIVEVIKTVYDPEIPVDIYELGLIYDIIVDAERRVLVKMTLTSPACPSAQQIPSEVRYKVKAVPGVTDAWVEIVWEPPWDKDRMSEAAKLRWDFSRARHQTKDHV